MNARNLAHVLMENGERKAAEKVILEVAQRPNAPVWFIRKGANILVSEGQLAEGVALMLREKAT